MSVSGFEARNNAEICGPVRPSSSASGFASPPVLSVDLPCPPSLTLSDAEAPPVGLPATPQRAYRLLDRHRSPSPAPSCQSDPSTPPRTALATQPGSPAVNPFGTPYAPRYFENTPNGSIHRAPSRASTPSRFASTVPRKLPPPPVFPDLRSVSPLNHGSLHERSKSENFEIEGSETDEDVYVDDGDEDLRSDFDYIVALQNPRAESPGLFNYPNSEYTIDDDYDDDLGKMEHSPSHDTRHYGPAPLQAQPRRLKAMTKKQVQLVQGNLVLDNPVPSKLTSFLPRRDPEFTHMRYTAATCDPDDFAKDGYTLRPALLGRETQLFIVVTMYNEDEILFTRTMHGIMRNIAHLCSRSKSRVWGKEGWQKVVVCVVADGRREMHPRVLDVLAAMGVYQDGIAKNLVNGKEVKAHIYEVLSHYTTQISVDPDLRFQGAEKGMVPVQVLFCLKEKNAKKLNSHRWFFNAFSPLLNPNVCVLLDVGTRPGAKSIYHLWKAFDHNSSVGGACGEIKAMKGRAWRALLNPLVAAQNFEYKMSNILDKPTESVFGYISVLPGAFSAYRYVALKNDNTGTGPLNSYFKGEQLHGKGADVFTANMYLAEDRILCWELVAKKKAKWILEYVPSATGETDVPDAVPELVSQRRRWLNGAFFAAVYAQTHFTQIWTTDHSLRRKIALHIEFFYQFVMLAFSFFSLANFYLTFYFVCSSLSDPDVDPFGGWADRIFTVLRYLCILLITSQFILSMGNRPQGARLLFTISMCGFSLIMAYTLFATVYLTIKTVESTIDNHATLWSNYEFSEVVLALMSTAGLYLLSSFLYLDPWHMFSSFLQFTLLLPSFVCTLQIYAFCNTHDVSWGTKGDNVIRTELGAAVSAGKGEKGDFVEVEVPSEQLDIDSAYDDALANVRERRPIPEKPVNESTLQEDYYREIRTRLVLIWIVSNATLAMALTEVYSTGLSGGNGYLKFILWAIAGLAAFRFAGSTAFLLINMVQRTARSKYYRKMSEA